MQWIDFTLLFGSIITILLLFLVVGILINAVFLGIALGFVNGENRELGTTFVTALLSAIVSVIPCLGCILAWYFIKTRHELGWGGAIAAWILTFIIEAIVIFVIILLAFPALFGIFALF
ncbi:MAG: hypothetical protein ACFFEF_01540 [Candidatus Thorarchaeota archaeon]